MHFISSTSFFKKPNSKTVLRFQKVDRKKKKKKGKKKEFESLLQKVLRFLFQFGGVLPVSQGTY